MKAADYIPADSLKPFIKAYKIIESSNGIVNRIVPNTSLTIAFRLKGRVSYVESAGRMIVPPSVFSGLRKSVRLINYAPDTATLLIMFKETGAAAFFRQPLYDLFEQTVSLDQYFPKLETSMVEERLAGAETNEAKIKVIEEFLCSKLLHNKPDVLIASAISRIYAENGNLKIKALADSLYISQDAFEKRFRKITGATPKQFASIVKMNNAIRKNIVSPSFLDIAFENGYYDQAHFNKDFKSFTGLTPTDFFRSASYW